MTQRSGPWEGTTVGDAGPYSHNDWARIWRAVFNASDPDTLQLIGTGTTTEPGLSVNPASPASMNVVVQEGDALVHGTWYQNDADVTFPVPANGSGNPRIDTIVLQKDWTAQTIRLVYKTGTPAASPSAPALTQSDGVTWESPVADIAVASGASSITSANITHRGLPASATRALIVEGAQNRTGAVLTTGKIVYWQQAYGPKAVDTQGNVATSINAAFRQIAGIWIGRTADMGYGQILQRGVGYIYVDSTVTAGRVLIPSPSTSGAAMEADVPESNFGKYILGVALESRTGAGLVLADIDIRPPRGVAASQSPVDNGANATTTSAVFVTPNFVNFTPEFNLRSATGIVALHLSAFGEHSVAGTLTHFDVLVDGVTRASALLDSINTFNNGLGTMRGLGAGVLCPAMFNVLVNVTPFVLHQFTLQWRTAAATASLYAGGGGAANDVPFIFWGEEKG